MILIVNILKTITKNLKAPVVNSTADIQSLTKKLENFIDIQKKKDAFPEIVASRFHFKSVRTKKNSQIQIRKTLSYLALFQ